jgi:DNA-directed RNA polymerase subunit L
MASFVVKNVSKDAFHLNGEFQGFPLTFVNGLRRIILSEIPTVVIRDVQILSNTTQMPHEMLKHRMELLPVNVDPSDTAIIKDATIELRLYADPENNRDITTDDFVIQSGREHILMRDRDLDTPLLFLRVKKGEIVHVKGRLAVENGSQVCTASTKFHIDEERAKIDREKYVETGGDPRVFDNFQIQKSYSIDELGRPNWIDMNIESVGVLKSKHILKLALQILKTKVDTWMTEGKDNISRESEKDVYHISLNQGGHTVGALLQEVIYHTKTTEFVSYDIPHPLKSEMVLRFLSKDKPEDVLKNAQTVIHEYCEIVEKGL